MSVVYQLVMGCDTCDRAEEHWESFAPGDVPDKRQTHQIAEERYGFHITALGRVLCDICAAEEEEQTTSPEGGRDVP